MKVKLTDWLNAKYVGKEKNLSIKFSKAKPFPHLQLSNFLRKDKADLLFKAISKEQFSLKESDLFKLLQSKDFANTNNIHIKSFRNFLASSEFINFMEKVTSTKLKQGTIDCGGSVYTSTCFLLPHDDRLDERSIAYIFYLSNLKKRDGGALKLYSAKNDKPLKVAKEMQPEYNSFSFFKVSKISYHEVGEVISDVPRISINGWFHDK